MQRERVVNLNGRWCAVMAGLRSLPRRLLILPIRVYQYVISPMIGPRCRFAPSCSEYAAEALSNHGVLRGGWLAVRRIVRCHPWGGSGYDPVPEATPKIDASHLGRRA